MCTHTSAHTRTCAGTYWLLCIPVSYTLLFLLFFFHFISLSSPRCCRRCYLTLCATTLREAAAEQHQVSATLSLLRKKKPSLRCAH